MILRFLSKSLLVAVLGLLLINEARTKPCSGPFISQKLQNLTTVVAAVGKDVMLPCRVKNGTLLHWLKNNKTLNLSPNMRVKVNRYLKIKRVRKVDAGFYTCVAGNECGNTDAFTWKVSLAEKPQFLYPNQMKLVKSSYKEGDTFHLMCDAKGEPTPVVTWYKDGKIFTGRHGYDDVIITPEKYDYEISFIYVDIEDKGNYTCIVKNDYGRLTHSYYFDVIEKVRSVPQIVIIWEQVGPVYAGSNLELFCNILTKGPNTRYRWYYSNTNVPDERKLGLPLNQSLYELFPYKNVESWPKWRLILKLKNVSVADSGFYGCQAENVLGNGTGQTYLNVTNRPIAPSVTEMSTTSGQEEQESEKSGNRTTKTSRIQYPTALIGLLAGAVVLLIIVSGWCYWQIKTSRAYSSAAKSRRPAIDSLRAKYEVQNEYVVVPDFNRST